MKINEILKSDIKINFKYIFLSKLNLLKKIYRRIKFNFNFPKFRIKRHTKRFLSSFLACNPLNMPLVLSKTPLSVIVLNGAIPFLCPTS